MSAPQARPPRPGAWLPSAPPAVPPAGAADGGALGTVLRDLPVAEHADVLAAEHDRLHRLLATIDQL
ncbi:hypothetical protein SAMN05660199_01347 [Klenkia soli]|uniref:Uncharacterized protein n=1 Tax=Klenkia soli TaxID=1052260 RepID=A0A1H0GTE8_9ACTN|nr:hypothetical protein [Klenkia soli]SDO10145.1 hypothetical protein SAMN05660199_01347 [Klenkia soli]